ncbi:HD domain-containing protein [Balneolales bacterium ANBcel1]|nr:HD domain-containing protein [Balneolales bacterium ANBcel1]
MQDLPESYRQLFRIISEAVSELGQKTYVIGGLVRDYYLRRIDPGHTYDIDLVTVGSGIRAAEAVAEKLGTDKIATYRRFGTARVTYRHFVLEFVGARRESYRSDSRKPIVEDGTLTDDQYRRDFTINALSWSLNPEDYGQLNDPFHGMRDLENETIRTPVDPVRTFSDDPLRMMRAIRFASQLHFSIDPDTKKGITESAERLDIVSRERIADELNKIVMSDLPSIGFQLMLDTGLLKRVLPELCDLQGVEEVHGIRHKDNFWHTLKVLDNVAMVSDNLWLRWAAILHDIAKPATKRFHPKQGWTFHGHDAVGARMVGAIFRRIGLPLDERMRYVKKLVRLHLRPIALVDEIVTDSAVRRLLFDAGDDIEDLMTLCRADITSKNDRKVKQYLQNFDLVEKKIAEVEEKDRIRNWKPPIGGEEIMEICGIGPGREVGTIKSMIQEAILSGTIANSREEAIAYLHSIKDSVLNNRQSRNHNQ